MRGGHFDKIRVQLCARPLSADKVNLADPVEIQQKGIEQYWRSMFEPIIKEKDSHRGAASRR